MKDPSRSSTSPSIISEDVIINGHSHEDDNPFAEYMWMENEEEFNRQASRCPLWMSRAVPYRVTAAGSGAAAC